MFAAVGGSDFHRQWAIGERGLSGEEDAAECAAAEFANQAELAQGLAGLRELRWGVVIVQEVMALQNDGERLVPLRKAAVEFGGVDMLAALLAETVFLVDNADRRFGIAFQGGLVSEALLGR